MIALILGTIFTQQVLEVLGLVIRILGLFLIGVMVILAFCLDDDDEGI